MRYSGMQENILGDIEKERAAQGHVTLGVKVNGKEFLAKYAYNEGNSLVFITKRGEVIKNQREVLASLTVVV